MSGTNFWNWFLTPFHFAKATYFRGRAFDAAVWRADAEIGSTARVMMADRLVARGSLVGLTRSQAVELLGEPWATDYMEADAAYHLGPERGFMGIDSEWLLLTFGSDGRITQAMLGVD